MMTSSPLPMSSARSASAIASVPLPTPTAWAAPQAAANSVSNASTSGPSTNQPRADDAVDGVPDGGVILGRRQVDEGDGRARAHSAATGDASVT